MQKIRLILKNSGKVPRYAFQYGDFVLDNIDVMTVDKIVNNLYVAKFSGIDQITAKFRKNVASLIAIHLANIRILSIKFDTFSSKCKIAKIKPLFKKEIKTEAKNYRPIFLLLLLSKLIENSIHNQTHGLSSMNCCTFINKALEQISLQIHVCLG